MNTDRSAQEGMVSTVDTHLDKLSCHHFGQCPLRVGQPQEHVPFADALHAPHPQV